MDIHDKNYKRQMKELHEHEEAERQKQKEFRRGKNLCSCGATHEECSFYKTM